MVMCRGCGGGSGIWCDKGVWFEGRAGIGGDVIEVYGVTGV